MTKKILLVLVLVLVLVSTNSFASSYSIITIQKDHKSYIPTISGEAESWELSLSPGKFVLSDWTYYFNGWELSIGKRIGLVYEGMLSIFDDNNQISSEYNLFGIMDWRKDSINFVSNDPISEPVPEPASILLLSSGICLYAARKKKWIEA